MDKISIYLAGNIQKGHEPESRIFWTHAEKQFLSEGLSPLKTFFLNPSLRADDLSDQMSVFGRDMVQVFCSDVIVVDARERRGLGVGAEMMWAKIHHLPVITLAPRQSHYCKEEVHLLGQTVKGWMHPFIESLSDVVVEDLSQVVLWLKDYCSGKMEDIKGYEFILKTMQHYKETRFFEDNPMKELAERNPTLRSKMEKITTLV